MHALGLEDSRRRENATAQIFLHLLKTFLENVIVPIVNRDPRARRSFRIKHIWTNATFILKGRNKKRKLKCSQNFILRYMIILVLNKHRNGCMGYLKDLRGERDGTTLRNSCLENPMDGGAWWAAVHGVAKSRTWLSDFTFHFHALEEEMATHSSVLAWRIPGTAEPGGLQSMGSHRVDTTEAT